MTGRNGGKGNYDWDAMYERRIKQSATKKLKNPNKQKNRLRGLAWVASSGLEVEDTGRRLPCPLGHLGGQ